MEDDFRDWNPGDFSGESCEEFSHVDFPDETFEDFLRRAEIENIEDYPRRDEPIATPDDSQLDPFIGDHGFKQGCGEDSAIDSVTNEPAADLGDSIDTALHVRLALQSQTPEVPKPIWETGIWSVIFGQGDMLDAYKSFGPETKRPAIIPDISGENTATGSSAKRLRISKGYSSVVKFKQDIAWQEQQDAFLQSALKLWYIAVCRWDDVCAFRIQLHELSMEDEALQMLSDIFSGKSPSTLRKRVLAVMKMCDHAELNAVRFPWSESDMYAFICHERQLGAPVSRIKGYMQAITFCRFVLEVKELQPILHSARCKGAAKTKGVKERTQASPLQVSELCRLHTLLHTGQDLWDRVFAGAVLFCVYARARWGDLMRAASVIGDYDRNGVLAYLEARVGQRKTMNAQQHRHLHLPMVAPSVGVDERNWSVKWLELRQLLGLSFEDDPRIMPAPQPDGTAGKRPLETTEAAAWLRLLLQGSSDLQVDRRLSSHSMKVTMLSYAAKRGLDIHLRMQLGYHSSPYKMGLTYSRDGAAASIMAMEGLLEEIRLGKFDPDDTRSGRIRRGGHKSVEVVEIKDEETEEPIREEVAEDSSSDSSSSSSSSDDSTVDEPAYDFGKAAKMFLPPVAPAGYRMWQHSKLKTLHLMDDGNQRVFACGRTAGPNHLKDGFKARYDTPVCSFCFTRADGVR